MSDTSGRVATIAKHVTPLEQTYALRASLAGLLFQVIQAEATIKHRIAELEHESQRLHVQLNQTTPTIASLRERIEAVDENIRRRHEEVRAAVAANASRPDELRTERREAGQEVQTEAHRPAKGRGR